jgi:hypothetical protein
MICDGHDETAMMVITNSIGFSILGLLLNLSTYAYLQSFKIGLKDCIATADMFN